MNHWSRERFDVCVIGGGVVGCALARVLAKQRRHVLLLEKELDLALHASGRAPGVVHPGFHAESGSLAARLCIEGNYAIRAYAASHQVPYAQVGTYLVATDDSQVSALEQQKGCGDRNGVPDLELLSGAQLRKREPALEGVAALYAPTGGVIDSRAFTASLAQDAAKHGAVIWYWQEVVGLEEGTETVKVLTRDGEYRAEMVINCAGVHASRLAQFVGVGRDYTLLPLRGTFFTVKPAAAPAVRSICSLLPTSVLPYAESQWIPTVQGDVIVGGAMTPSVNLEDYTISHGMHRTILSLFQQVSVRNAMIRHPNVLRVLGRRACSEGARLRLWKEMKAVVRDLQLDDLAKGSRVGIHGQLVRSNGEFVDDLVVESTARSVHVLNMVAPGLTCSLSFAKWLTDRMQGAGHGAKFKTPYLSVVS